MLAKKLECRVLEITWLCSSVMKVRLQADRRFTFEAGQFLSIIVPSMNKRAKPIKRLYSFSSSPTEAAESGICELCVKYVPGGKGTEFLRSLEPGDRIQVAAPYGDFLFVQPPSSHRNVCFISTGTGIAPMRSIALSAPFQEQRPRKAFSINGVRNEEEILYADELKKLGVEPIYAVSQASISYQGFKGRVTDYLKQLPESWQWQNTDFYLCGNGEMIAEVDSFLRSTKGVPATSIHKESFSTPRPESANVLPFKKNTESFPRRLFGRSVRSKI